MSDSVSKHFVNFLSPGTFVSESTTREIESWDVEKAQEIAKEIIERHHARPYAFYFSTRSRGPQDLDSKETATSKKHYLGGKVTTLAEVLARDLPNENILRSNMQNNNISAIWEATEGWSWTQPFNEGDVHLANFSYVRKEEATPA